MGEHLLCKQKVIGSIPIRSTNDLPDLIKQKRVTVYYSFLSYFRQIDIVYRVIHETFLI